MYLDRIPQKQVLGLVKKLYDHQFHKKSPQKEDDWEKDFENSNQKKPAQKPNKNPLQESP